MQVYRLYMIIDKQGTVVTLYTSRCVQYYIKMTNHPFSSKLWWCVTSSLLWSYCYGPSDPPHQKRPHCQYWCSMWLLTSASLVFVERLASCSSPAWACNHFPRKTAHLKCEFKRIETIKKNCMIFFYEYQQQNMDCFRVYACYSLTILFHYSYSDSYVFFIVD